MNDSFTFINSAANSIGSQFQTIWSSTKCVNIYPCANQTYINLKNLIIQTHQKLVDCVAPISTYMQTNGTKIIVQYTGAANGLVNAVNFCSSNMTTFDSCLIVSVIFSLFSNYEN